VTDCILGASIESACAAKRRSFLNLLRGIRGVGRPGHYPLWESNPYLRPRGRRLPLSKGVCEPAHGASRRFRRDS
jgi:hypothetical protein